MAHEEDKPANMQYGTILADAGEQVSIRPHSFVEHVKNPEFEVYNRTQIADPKKTAQGTKNAIEKGILSASEQNVQVVIFGVEEQAYDKLNFIRALNNTKNWDKATSITEVWIARGKQLIKVAREEIQLKMYYHKLP